MLHKNSFLSALAVLSMSAALSIATPAAAVLIDFNTRADGSAHSGLILPGDEYSSLGVTFTDSFLDPNEFSINASQGTSFAAIVAADISNASTFLEMHFNTLVTDVSFETGAGLGGYTIEAFDASNSLVLSITAPAVGTVLLGAAEFMRLHVRTTLNRALRLDDLNFTPIPEPTSLAILALGSLALIRRRETKLNKLNHSTHDVVRRGLLFGGI